MTHDSWLLLRAAAPDHAFEAVLEHPGLWPSFGLEVLLPIKGPSGALVLKILVR